VPLEAPKAPRAAASKTTVPKTGRRLGRPVASDGDERRRLIIEVARREFARTGYVGTTNREIAEQAGITTGAIYHYFRSKKDVYLAVFEETDRVILARYREVTADPSLTFDEMVAGLLEVSSQLNSEDESLAAFLASASVDAHRDPEIMPSYLQHDRQMSGFFAQLVDTGIDEGIIAADSRSDILDAIRVLTLGLTWFSVRVHDPAAHRRATAATVRALRGQLFVAAQPRRRRAAR
jgi:AcrR family transcriptional regulator